MLTEMAYNIDTELRGTRTKRHMKIVGIIGPVFRKCLIRISTGTRDYPERFLVVLVSPSKEISGWYLDSGRTNLASHLSLYHHRPIVSILKALLHNLTIIVSKQV
jgi:hypothetical protein